MKLQNNGYSNYFRHLKGVVKDGPLIRACVSASVYIQSCFFDVVTLLCLV